MISYSPSENSALCYSRMDASLSPISHENFSLFYFCCLSPPSPPISQMHPKLQFFTEKTIIFSDNKTFAERKKKKTENNKTIWAHKCPEMTVRPQTTFSRPVLAHSGERPLKLAPRLKHRLTNPGLSLHLCFYWVGSNIFWTILLKKKKKKYNGKILCLALFHFNTFFESSWH